MLSQILKLTGMLLLLALLLTPFEESEGQAPEPQQPDGVEVLARGPVHEAFAAPSVEPKATPLVAKKPPAPIEEMPPDEKPEGDVVWIPGYWAFDDERGEYMWVSGCWRTKPPGKEWVAGYWREHDNQAQWVSGFWTAAAQPTQAAVKQEVTYYPAPPAPPQIAPPGEAPAVDAFFVPGNWVWQQERYVWQAGYWGRIREGYVWVPAHYRWTPYGYIFVGGYWDLVVTRRGVLYTPVSVNLAIVGPRFVFTPRFAVCDAVVLDALFVRPSHCHYYFGDYYGAAYARVGFVSCAVYSRHCYDPVFTYARYEHRHDPRWFDVQVNLVVARDAGRAPRPPRTLVQQNTIIQKNVTNVTNVNVTNVYNTQVIAPTKVVTAARGQQTVALDAKARAQVQQNAINVNQTAIQQRKVTESAAAPTITKPRIAPLNIPTTPATTSIAPKTPQLGPTTTPKLGPTPPKTGPVTPPTLKGPSTTPLKGPTTGPITRPSDPPHVGPSAHPLPKGPPVPFKKAPEDKKKKGPNDK